ncbi:MAG: DUF547 domain-containing protein [Bacteroidota bacterium]
MKFTLFFWMMLLPILTGAQTSLGIGKHVGKIPVQKVLNAPAALTSLPANDQQLLVIDFFGTWCAPCKKAIPHLTALQNQFKKEIQIVLVSIETEAKLNDFIKKQNNFMLPIVVDQEQNYTRLFQPPSYPYTIVIGKKGNIVAIPSPEEMTSDNISKWLDLQEGSIMKGAGTDNEKSTKPLTSRENTKTIDLQPSNNKLVQLSQELMYAAKTGDATSAFVANLKNTSLNDLEAGLKTDDEKKAFWINLYNAFTQIILKANPDAYKKRGHFFGSKQIEIAGHRFSLDNIEHGILRRSKVKWSLGYLNKLFPSKIEKALRVDRLDYRLHFALNCGAKSCPPIAFYKPETINQQLDMATKTYLAGEVEYNKDANKIRLPVLMSWFRKDFGGKKKMIELVQQLSIIPANIKPKIAFKKYDWTLFLENYKS